MEKKFRGKDAHTGRQIVSHVVQEHTKVTHHPPLVGDITEPVGDVVLGQRRAFLVEVPGGNAFSRRTDLQPVLVTESNEGVIIVFASRQAIRHLIKSVEKSNKKSKGK